MTRRSTSFPKREQLDIFQYMAPRKSSARSDKPPIRSHDVAGLFAGIGGIELGLGRSGHRANLLCEIEPAARAVLQARFPSVPLAPDITKLERLPESTTLVAGGFPCQDLSQAGKTAGIEGRNSGLVTHVFRLLETQRVPWLLLENVSFMLRLARGNAMRFVLDEVERLGYRWAYRIIDARSFGLPQRRERVYLVACLPDQGDPREVLLALDHGPPTPPKDFRKTANGFYWTEGIRGLGWAIDSVPTLKGGSTIGIASPPAIWLPDGRIVKPDIRDGENLQGFPTDWTEPALLVAKPGMRWKLVGNAVSVRAAEWLGEQMKRPADYDDAADYPMESRAPLPDAAWSLEPGRRFVSHASRWPEGIPSPPLEEFLQFPPIPLSERATTGFLSRVRTSSLHFPEGFVSALEQHLQRMSREPALA
jgi:DNA (cytosine-5)-methyltransferase 1